MNKTFIEFLNELNKDEMVYVGTKHGTNWIVIDRPDRIIELLDNIENELHAQVLRTYEVASSKLVDIPFSIVRERRALEDLMEVKNRDVTTFISEVKGRISNLEESFVNAHATCKKTGKILKKWVDIRDRQVVEVYEHETDIPGTSVILEGHGNGTLWWYGEKTI